MGMDIGSGLFPSLRCMSFMAQPCTYSAVAPAQILYGLVLLHWQWSCLSKLGNLIKWSRQRFLGVPDVEPWHGQMYECLGLQETRAMWISTYSWLTCNTGLHVCQG